MILRGKKGTFSVFTSHTIVSPFPPNTALARGRRLPDFVAFADEEPAPKCREFCAKKSDVLFR